MNGTSRVTLGFKGEGRLFFASLPRPICRWTGKERVGFLVGTGSNTVRNPLTQREGFYCVGFLLSEGEVYVRPVMQKRQVIVVALMGSSGSIAVVLSRRHADRISQIRNMISLNV